MFENAIEVLKLIEKKGFKAYIVGGYVRDIYLSNTSTDIDICTSAKPKDLVKIFKKKVIIDEKYGSVKLEYKNSCFDITTFRKDIKYKDNRRPSEIEYVDLLEEDFGENESLVMAEVELFSRDEEVEFPEFIGDEVTGDPRYYNTYLRTNPYKDWE